MHVRVSLGRNAISRVITTSYFQRYQRAFLFGPLYSLMNKVRLSSRRPPKFSTATLISLRATLNAALSGSKDAR